MSIAENILKIRAALPAGVSLVAVSKFHPVESILEAYNAGQFMFGESRVQELAGKVPKLPDDILWHFIGHLQTNKVRALLSLRPALIESIDSVRLLRAVDGEAKRQGFTARVLMQLHVAAEQTKFGFTPSELLDFFSSRGFESLESTHICGVMGMASNTDDTSRIADDFSQIHRIFSEILHICPDLQGFDTVSMGMSDDYPIAVAKGSTLVRVGSAIFGPRF